MFNFKRFGAAAMAVLMVMSIFGMAFAGGAAATITADGDFAGDGTDEVLGFEAAEGENNTAVYETEQTFDADAMTADEVEDPANWDTLELTVEYANNTLVTYTATAEDISFDDTATGETPAEVTFTVEDSDLEKLPGDAGQITTADVTVTEVFEDAGHADADEDDMVEATEAFAVDYEFANTYAAITVFDADDDAFATFDTEDKWFGLAESTDLSFDESVGVDGDNTTIHAHVADDDMADEFDAIAEDADDGDMLGAMMTSSVDGDMVYVFNGEAGDEVDADKDTYIVYNEGGEFVTELGDDHTDSEEVSMNVVGLETPGFGDLTSSLDFSWTEAASFSVSSMLSSLNPF